MDIAVYAVTNKDLLDYKLDLEEELERRMGYPIDVAILNEAPSWFVKEGKILLTRQSLLLEKLYLKAIDEERCIKFFKLI